MDSMDEKYYERFIEQKWHVFMCWRLFGGFSVLLYTFLILLTGAAMALYEVPKLIEQQMWREVAAFAVFLFVGIALAIALTLGIHVPNPTRAIEIIFSAFFG